VEEEKLLQAFVEIPMKVKLEIYLSFIMSLYFVLRCVFVLN